MAENTAELMRGVDAALDALLDLEPGELADSDAAELLVGLMQRHSRLEALIARVAAQVDASRSWADDGSRSCAAWLSRVSRRHRGDAAGVIGRGRALRHMPEVAEHHAAGRLSARHVRALAAAQKLAPDAYAGDEAWLVARAVELSFADFSTVVAYWCQCAAPDEAEDRALARYRRRSLRLSPGLDGSGHLDVEFEPVGYATVAEALRRIEQELWEEDWAEARRRLGEPARAGDLARSDAQRRYDALIEMARRSVAAPPGARRPVPLVTVHVDHETMAGRICELSTGVVLTPGEVLPLLCEADVERAVFGPGSRVIDLGRRSRLFVGGTRRAVQIGQRTCVHPTCEIRSEQCDIHHIVDWEDGGRTDRVNGEPRCPAHHPGRRRRSGRTDTDAPDP
ncbi:MAG: DUF222 domain-containing protein [Acidimicrobiales bacterium]